MMPTIQGHIAPPRLSCSRLSRRSSSGSRGRSVNGSVCLGIDMSPLQGPGVAADRWKQRDCRKSSKWTPDPGRHRPLAWRPRNECRSIRRAASNSGLIRRVQTCSEYRVRCRLRTAERSAPLSLPQPGRTLLQQAQAFQSRRHPIRQNPGKSPRIRQTCLSQNLDAI
jgi:hypothetical protein